MKSNKTNFESKKANNLIMILAFAIVLIALVNFAVTFIKISQFKNEITGFGSLGYVNLSVVTRLQINVTNTTVDWGAGAINAGETNATLFTKQLTSSVLRGNWSKDPDALVIQNDGSVNVSVALTAAHNATGLFGQVGEQMYQWNVTNREAGSCEANASLGLFYNVNTTSGGTKFCNQLGYLDNQDEIYIDTLLSVPYNTTNQSTSGTYLLDTITVTANTAG